MQGEVRELQQGIRARSTPFSESQGVLYHHYCLYAPAGETRAQILHLCHDDSLPAGHFGMCKTVNLVPHLFCLLQMKGVCCILRHLSLG